jgi:metallo-beta-lactamase family protein
VKFIFRNSGHILGAATIELDIEGKKLVFSGDLGNYPVPIVPKYTYINEADYVFIESTYGGITHEAPDVRVTKFKQAVYNVFNKQSVLLIPSFALERTQEILFELNMMVESGEIVPLPVFMDSPLASKITQVFKKYEDFYNKETMKIINSGDDIFNFSGLQITDTVDESKKINSIPGPKIIIAGSGMCTGGRILKHLQRYIKDPNNFLLFVGYQAKGTLGRKIFDGEEVVEIEGREYKVRLNVDAIGGYSAHSDQPKSIEWLSHFDKNRLKKIFIIHGEKDKAEALSAGIKAELGIDTYIPVLHDEVML